MRDLKRANAKCPAYVMLADMNVEVFTPLQWRVVEWGGKRERRLLPYMPDLLFAHTTRRVLDPIVARTDTLQYRWLRHAYMKPMTVSEEEMTRFIHAVNTSHNPLYLKPEEVAQHHCGKQIRIIGGPLNGYEGRLLTVRGSKTKRLIVEMRDLFSVGVEVDPEYIVVL